MRYTWFRLAPLIALTGFVAVSPLAAEQYWIAYEANDDGVFPEDCGWNRVYGDWQGQWHGCANRTVENGIFTSDSLHDTGVYDFVYMERPGQVDPGPGELFVMQWRLKVEELVGRVDPTVGVAADTKWKVGFQFDEDSIHSVFETGVTAYFAPGLYHRFELRSVDMLSYDLWIDGTLAIEGSFWLSATESYVGWGDGVQGAASLSRWDYFRFGVVPEPESLMLYLTLLAIGTRSGVIRKAQFA
ncbi:MAG: hypothetical protein KKB50_00405 [Planctomycetes bacterium]|nr:hypothetical protein [Planctomycetota bacterium]